MSEPPLLRIVRGRPSAEETAALMAVLVAAQAARRRAARQAATGATGTWASHARALRVPPAPGANAWRRSALPG